MKTQEAVLPDSEQAHDPEKYVKGIKVEKSIVVNRPVTEVYQFWHNFENLPLFMRHVKKVKVLSPGKTHWTIHAPAKTTIEWDAEIIEEQENQFISWHSLAGSEVANAGTVHFAATPDGKGTEVHLSLHYDPPGGVLGKYVAIFFGEDPEDAIAADLQQFKTLMESADNKDTKELPISG